jgi:hypothetical protein
MLSALVFAMSPLTVPGQAPSLARLDRSAEELIAEVRCNAAVTSARERGAVGPTDSLGPSFVCARTAAPSLGANFSIAPSSLRVTALRLVNLETQRRDRSAFDTASIATKLHALMAGHSPCRPAAARADDRLPIVLRTEADTIEVWWLPLSQFGGLTGAEPQSVGGECGVVFSPDGRHVVRIVDASDGLRAWHDSSTGTAVIESRERDMPLFSEILAVHQLALRQRGAIIQTKQWIFARTGPMWLAVRRSAP